MDEGFQILLAIMLACVYVYFRIKYIQKKHKENGNKGDGWPIP